MSAALLLEGKSIGHGNKFLLGVVADIQQGLDDQWQSPIYLCSVIVDSICASQSHSKVGQRASTCQGHQQGT